MRRATRFSAFDHEVRYCTFCPKLCRFACPVAEAERSETVTPTAKATLMYAVERGLVELERESAEPWFHCTGCGLHATACEHQIDLTAALRAARAAAAAAGLVPEPLEEALGGPGASPAASTALLLDALPDAPERGEASLLPGLPTVLRAAPLVRRVQRSLAALYPEPPARWPGPLDLGLPLLAAGLEEELAQRAEAVARAAAPFRRLWVLDPEEAWLLRSVYPSLGVRLEAEVLLPLEALDTHLDQVASAPTPGPPTVYHDPCYLGRRLGVYDAPRRIVAALTGCAAQEPPFARAESWCCGGGGGYPDLDPAAARAAAARRLAMLLEGGARRVVTACPRCREQLRAAAEGQDVAVLDLFELLP